MNFAGHLSLGLLTFFALMWGATNLDALHVLQPRDTGIALLAFLVTMYGSVAPDLDARGSRVFAITTAAIAVASLAALALGKIDPVWMAIFLIGFLIASLIPKHRGRFHSLPAAAVYGVLLFFVFRDPSIALFGTSGYVSHVFVGDSFLFKKRHKSGFV